MKIFIDSADLSEIRDAAQMGVIDGVTTNPSLVAKAGKPMRELIAAICEIVDGPISAEVLATDAEGIVREGRVLAAIHPNVVVKVPLIADGLKAVRIFAKEGIKTNVTLCFSASQGLLAAKAGATYISPFVGRIDDVSGDGMDLVAQLCTIYRNYDLATEVLAASIRHPVHVVQAAELGAHVATLPHKVIHQLLKHPLTASGLETFLADAKKIPDLMRAQAGIAGLAVAAGLAIVAGLAASAPCAARADDGVAGALGGHVLLADGDVGGLALLDVWAPLDVVRLGGFFGAGAIPAPSARDAYNRVMMPAGVSAALVLDLGDVDLELRARGGLWGGATQAAKLTVGGLLGGGAFLNIHLGGGASVFAGVEVWGILGDGETVCVAPGLGLSFGPAPRTARTSEDE